MKTKYVYVVLNDQTIFSSRFRAHNHICELAKKNDLLPYKETLYPPGGVLIHYPGSYKIRKTELNVSWGMGN